MEGVSRIENLRDAPRGRAMMAIIITMMTDPFSLTGKKTAC